MSAIEGKKEKERLLRELEQLRGRIRELETDLSFGHETLKPGEGCYRDLFEESKDGIYVSSRDGKILDVNKASEELFGYTREEMTGMDICTLYADPVDREKFQQEIEEQGAVKDYEIRLRRKDRAELYCLLTSSVRRSLDGVVLGYQGIIHDITEYKKAERALRSSEEKFSKVFHSSPDWIAITTLSEGRFIDVNEAFLKITGYTRKEVIGRTFAELGLWVDSDGRAKLVELLLRHRVVRDFEARYRLKSGEIRTMLRSAELIELDGETCIINVVRDITERKRAEEEIRKLNEELEKRVKELLDANRELDAFTSSVSHDLRVPLVSTGGYARRLEKRYAHVLDEKGTEMLDAILEGTKKMEELIDALLAFSRSGRQQVELSEIDMEEMMKSVFEELKTTVPDRTIHFRTGRLLPIYADGPLVRQVLVNLLSNAFKFTRPKKIAVIEVDSRFEGDSIVYSVKDNGVGFNVKNSGRLFDIFQRLHSAEDFEGTGVGLSIAHRIITRHGGRIWAEGRAGEGATFYFSLPLGNQQNPGK